LTVRLTINRRRVARNRLTRFHRLNGLPVNLPRLCAHVEDVPALVGFYVDTFNRELRIC
jgi:transcriptional regulator with GAF, ATPase, and Fis domain